MNQEINNRVMAQLAEKMGIPIAEKGIELAALQLHDIRIIDLLPEMMMMIRSLVCKEEFVYRRKPITVIKNGLLISFQNVFNAGNENLQVNGPGTISNQQRAHVRITPLHLESEVKFPKQAHVRQITILIETTYLRHFLGKEQDKFSHLFRTEETFWIDEFMSPEISLIVDEVLNSSSDIGLPDFYYRIKSLDLLYFLFRNLSQRKSISHQNMSKKEIDAIYNVRNAMAASLDKALTVKEMVRLSGMNELKLRKLFTQVFGKGLYPYFQHLRMQEAARLLKEERLSVSETGYRFGFTNLSHFGRLFEEHMGVKPKKWSSKHN